MYQGYTESYGAVCYSITKRGASYLVDISLPLQYATDGITNWLTAYWTTGYKGYVILPTPVWTHR